MQKLNDLIQSRLVLRQDNTLIAVIEMSLSSWLVAGIVPGIERQPLKKLVVDESALRCNSFSTVLCPTSMNRTNTKLYMRTLMR